MQNDTRIAVDVAKSVFEIAVSDRPGHVVRRERLPRDAVPGVLRPAPCRPPWSWRPAARRTTGDAGSRPSAIASSCLPPHHVRPYVRGNKTDRTDAKGILEASRNEDIRPVPVKTVAQQVLTSLHRLRSGWMTERTARLNTLRGLLRELGVFIPVGAREVVPAVWALLEDADSDLPDALRPLFAEACHEIRDIEARDQGGRGQLEAMAKELPVVGVPPAPSPASASSPPPPSSPSSETSIGSPPAGTWPATWGSPRGSSRAASSATWGASPSAATATCAPSSSTAPAPSFSTPAPSSPTASASGHTSSPRPTSTTRPPSPWPTRWPASSGPSGADSPRSQRSRRPRSYRTAYDHGALKKGVLAQGCKRKVA